MYFGLFFPSTIFVKEKEKENNVTLSDKNVSGTLTLQHNL